MTRFGQTLLTACLLAGLLGPGAASVRAGFVTSLHDVNPEAGGFRWTYDINLDQNTTIKQGDFFTIFDFAGFVPGTGSGPAGWEFSSSLVGATPLKTTPLDDESKPNLTWTYVNATPLLGPLTLNRDFTARSEFGDPTVGDFGSKTHRTDNLQAIFNVSATTVPVPGATPPVDPEEPPVDPEEPPVDPQEPPVEEPEEPGIPPGEVPEAPEPTTLVMLGIATAGLLGYGWRRRQRQSA